MLSPAHARAVALALLGFSAFACGDATNKWLTAHYGAFQIMATQSALAIPLLLAAAPFLGGARSALSAAHWTLHLARAGLYVLVVTMVLFAFARLPLATFYTAVFTTPLVAALLSMVLYGERPCLRRWAAIAGGFAGVLLAFRPGLAEIPGGWAPWVVLAATVPIAMLQISARAMPRASALTLGLWPMVGGALGGSLLAWHGGGVAWVEPAHWPLFALGAVCIATGTVCLALGFRSAPTALVAPFHYSQMIWGVALGWLVFGDLPDAWTMAGAGVIVASGLALIWTERAAPGSES